MSDKALTVLLAAGLFLGGLALIVGLSALIGWIFMLLWNGIVVSVFDAPELGFFQAWGLWFLISMISKLFRSSSSEKED